MPSQRAVCILKEQPMGDIHVFLFSLLKHHPQRCFTPILYVPSLGTSQFRWLTGHWKSVFWLLVSSVPSLNYAHDSEYRIQVTQVIALYTKYCRNFSSSSDLLSLDPI